MSSKAAASVKSQPVRRAFRRALIAVAVTAGAALSGAAAVMPDGRPTPTRLEVPRWVSLKSDRVRARQGPGLDYRILWEYRASGLPLQVIAETREWRKVCDADGSIAWIHRSVASGRRSVFNAAGTDVAVHASRDVNSGLRARLAPRSVVAIDSCAEGWCRVKARRVRGWVRADDVFGAAERPLCDARRPAG